MSDLTINNINSIRAQMALKIDYNRPYYATRDAAGSVLTDFDHFPFKRFYRGVYDAQQPVVIEREAGYRPRMDSCYTLMTTPQYRKQNYCWEFPCSTVFPCRAPKDVEDIPPTQTECKNKINFSV